MLHPLSCSRQWKLWDIHPSTLSPPAAVITRDNNIARGYWAQRVASITRSPLRWNAGPFMELATGYSILPFFRTFDQLGLFFYTLFFHYSSPFFLPIERKKIFLNTRLSVDDWIFEMCLLCFSFFWWIGCLFHTRFWVDNKISKMGFIWLWYRDWIAFGCKQLRKIMRWGKWRIWLLLGRDGKLWYFFFVLFSFWAITHSILLTRLIHTSIHVYFSLHVVGTTRRQRHTLQHNTDPNLNQFPCLDISLFFQSLYLQTRRWVIPADKLSYA